MVFQSVTAILLQSATPVITKYDRYCKVRQVSLQGATGTTKCGQHYYKVWWYTLVPSVPTLHWTKLNLKKNNNDSNATQSSKELFQTFYACQHRTKRRLEASWPFHCNSNFKKDILPIEEKWGKCSKNNICSIIIFHWVAVKSQVLQTERWLISGEAAGEIWNLLLLGVKE